MNSLSASHPCARLPSLHLPSSVPGRENSSLAPLVHAGNQKLSLWQCIFLFFVAQSNELISKEVWGWAILCNPPFVRSVRRAHCTQKGFTRGLASFRLGIPYVVGHYEVGRDSVATVSRTNFWLVCGRSRPLANQPKHFPGWFATVS